jgi:hypothetical protein
MDDINSPDRDLETIRNPDTDFERSDLPVGVIALVALALAILLVICPVVLLYGFSGIGADVNRSLRVLPPEPRLQTYPARDLQAELSQQRRLLSSYGWVDRDHRVAHIPISESIKRIAASGIDGFPAPSPQEPQP